jgi:hypothetical protein
VLYLNISENTLDPINCRRILAEDGTKSDRQFMVSQPAEVCWETRFPTLQQELAPYAFTFFFLYTIGYPALVSYILLKPENREKCMNDQYLRCMGTGSRKETNKSYFNHRLRFATLYFKFKPKYYWWILLIVFRKLCIVSFTLLFHVNATMQLSMILLIMFLSYTAQIKYSPYLSRADYEDILGEMTEEDYQGLVGPYGTCPQPKGIGYDAMLEEKTLKGEYAMTRVSTTAMLQDKLKKGGISSEDLKAFGGLALKALFDYNTVEAVLLFCAILVCLFGIMFASEFSGPGEPLYERLGELTLAVIGVSLTYYFLVVWTEVVAVMFPSLNLSFVSGAVQGNRDQMTLDDDGNVVEASEKDITYDDSDEEMILNAASQGLDHDERDEYMLRQLERDVVYVDTNPIVAREMADELANKPKGEDKGEEGPVLLGVEEQVALQETVEKLMKEVSELKKKEALAAAAGVGSGGGGGTMGDKQKKKTKHKVGKGKHDDDDDDGGGGEGKKKGASMKSLFGKKKGADDKLTLRETMSSNIEFGYNHNDEDDEDDFGSGAHQVKMGSVQPSFQSHTNPLMAMRQRTNTGGPLGVAGGGGGASKAKEPKEGEAGFVYPLGRTASTLDIKWDGTDGAGGGGGGGAAAGGGGGALKGRMASAMGGSKKSAKKGGPKKAVKMMVDDFDDDGAL